MEGKAIVYCEGAYNTPNGKTAHGLVRFTERYNVAGVIDSRYAGRDAGKVLDGIENGILIFSSLEEALLKIHDLEYFVVGLAPDGGRLNVSDRKVLYTAAGSGLNLDSGLHDFLSEDKELVKISASNGSKIRDVRKTPDRGDLHFFSGKISEVDCLKVVVLGTDSAVGKRTTAWKLVHGFREKGLRAEMIGTGQTAWMQGAKYSLILDSLINDFVSGEIEHAVYQAWKNEAPHLIVLEGQGSLLNPAYPGGFELLAAGRPDFVVLQHAPARKTYDGFPDFKMHDIQTQIRAIELISGKQVIAITVNHEGIETTKVPEVCAMLERETGLICTDVLVDGPQRLVDKVSSFIKQTE